MADELTRRIEVCLQNWADDQAEGRPYYDPHDQWAACIEVLQEVHKTRATPEPIEAWRYIEKDPPPKNDDWFQGLTTHDTVVACKFIAEDTPEGDAFGSNEYGLPGGVRFKLKAWQPLAAAPHPAPIPRKTRTTRPSCFAASISCRTRRTSGRTLSRSTTRVCGREATMADELRPEIEEKISEILLRSFDWADDQDEARRDIVSEIYDRCITRARAEAFEEAAKVADEHAKDAPVVRDDCDVRLWIEPVAAAIRALARQAP